jgi:hypothetical protein
VQQINLGEQKLLKLCGHFSLALILGASSLTAESFADFKKTQQASFTKHKDEKDNEFNKYLAQQWKEYNVYKGTPLFEKPKPKQIAPAKEKKLEIVGPPVYIKVEEPKVKPEPKPKPEPKEKPKPIVEKEITFDFFGTKLGFTKPTKIEKAKFSPQNKEGITNFFNVMASSDTKELLLEISNTKQKLNLNDWGLYLLVQKISEKMYASKDEARLMDWFIFNKLGYAVRVGLTGNSIVLLHHSKKTIYSTPNYKIENQKFYVLSHYNKGSAGKLYTYEQNYPGASKALDLALATLPTLEVDTQQKTLEFKNYAQTHTVAFEYNKNLIDFMSTYPQADYETFFNAPLDEKSYQAIAQELKKIIDGKKASEAMNIVLRFVQNAFKYQRDDEQFGREKVMFAQETLYYDRSDCEDRSTLFASLIKELFGVGVVGIKYKDHIATALQIPLGGDRVTINQKEFVIADPTYINANIGQSMPQYKSIRPESFVVVQSR